MKRTLTPILSVVYLILISLNLFANRIQHQERSQTIENGISLIGDEKIYVQKYFAKQGFTFDNKTRNGDMIVYSKRTNYGKSNFSYAGSGKTVEVVSWTEFSIFGQDVLTEIKDDGFQINLDVVNRIGIGGIKTFSCYNNLRNLAITLIFRPEDSFFSINIGKINPNEPTLKLIQNNPNDIPDIAFSTDFFNNVNYSKYDVLARDNDSMDRRMRPLILYFFEPKGIANGTSINNKDGLLTGEVLIYDREKNIFFKTFKIRYERLNDDKVHGDKFYVYNITENNNEIEKDSIKFTVTKKTKPNTFFVPGKSIFYEFSIQDTDRVELSFFGNLVK